jgi:hypothetical protein
MLSLGLPRIHIFAASDCLRLPRITCPKNRANLSQTDVIQGNPSQKDFSGDLKSEISNLPFPPGTCSVLRFEICHLPSPICHFVVAYCVLRFADPPLQSRLLPLLHLPNPRFPPVTPPCSFQKRDQPGPTGSILDQPGAKKFPS